MKNRPAEINGQMLEKLKRASADDPGLMEFAHNLSSGKIVPLEEGALRSNSVRAMNEQLGMQMEQIISQIKLLAGQVEDLQERRRISELVYTARFTFEPVVGQSYHLYDRGNERFISLIGPDEWGKSGANLTFLAKVTLLADRTWKIEQGDVQSMEISLKKK
jgi:hypothetical protein